MTGIIFVSLLIKLIVAVIAYACIRVVLRRMDKVSKINFYCWWHGANDLSRSIYLSARIVSICLLFGLILSA